MLSAVSGEFNSGLVGGGAGNDTVVVLASTGIQMSVRGGNGNDSINFDFSAGSKTVAVDGDGTLTGDDTINGSFGFAFSSNTVDGGLGNDSIVLSGLGTDGGSNLYLADAGKDTVFFQSAGESDISGSTIKGGAVTTQF